MGFPITEGGVNGFSDYGRWREGIVDYPAFAVFAADFILAGLPLTPAIETETPACDASALILAMASCLRCSIRVLISPCAQVITCESSASESALTASYVMAFSPLFSQSQSARHTEYRASATLPPLRCLPGYIVPAGRGASHRARPAPVH